MERKVTRPLFDNPVKTPVHPNFAEARWRLYEFANGWGASVVSGGISYGGSEFWELAVSEGAGKALRYDTPITNDVIGWLDEDEVEELLVRISELPQR